MWWDTEGVVHWELLPSGMTINAEVYCSQLDRVEAALTEKRPHREKVLLLHDNATPHTAKKTKRHLQQKKWVVLPHPPYSPDIAPTDFKFFRSLQNSLRGKEFKDEDEVQLFIEGFIASKSSGFFVKGFTDLPKRWKEVIENEGEYCLD